VTFWEVHCNVFRAAILTLFPFQIATKGQVPYAVLRANFDNPAVLIQRIADGVEKLDVPQQVRVRSPVLAKLISVCLEADPTKRPSTKEILCQYIPSEDCKSNEARQGSSVVYDDMPIVAEGKTQIGQVSLPEKIDSGTGSHQSTI